jgi:hypothetical protein
VLAEEVLYCVDKAAIGFKWNRNGEASRAQFEPNRYTIKVVSYNREKRPSKSAGPPQPIQEIGGSPTRRWGASSGHCGRDRCLRPQR